MKSASQSAQKFVERASAATGDYISGAEQTSKDQSALAISAIPRMKAELIAAIDSGRVAKGLSESGKAGWLKGIREKGAERIASGVSASAGKYATNSGKYDSARTTADNMPKGLKGSETNWARSKSVGMALRKIKTGM